MNNTVKKIIYRKKRLFYVLRKSNLKDWISILFKSHHKILLDAIVLKYEGTGKYREEVAFLKEEKRVVPFPYKKIKQITDVISGYDPIKNLPYVIHAGRRLYFTAEWSEERALREYKNFIESENILGGGYSEKAPHQYQTDTFRVKANDILLDVGCAEALFALDVMDQVKKIFLFESDPIWFAPLQATFEKEIASGKVVLIEKFVSKENTEKTVTLDSILAGETYESLFIKMDIEGNEPDVIKSCENLMQSDKEIRFSCCTYHKENDAITLKSLFEQHGYQTEFSDGYVLFSRDKLIRYPYFRRGIIRAWR
jgi:hypothetical protein